MPNRWTSLAYIGAVWSLSSSVFAAEEPLSYAADNQCFCNLSATSALHDRIVATPVGGQSVSQVCERIGKGPALVKVDGEYNFPVFDDMQCGHGPGNSGFIGLLNGPKTGSTEAPEWNLAAAYGASGQTYEAVTEAQSNAADTSDAVAGADISDAATGARSTKKIEPVVVQQDTADQTAPTPRFKSTYVKVLKGTSNVVSAADVITADVSTNAQAQTDAAEQERKTTALAPVAAPTPERIAEAAPEPVNTIDAEPRIAAADASPITAPTAIEMPKPTPSVSEAQNSERLRLPNTASNTVSKTVIEESFSSDTEIEQVAETLVTAPQEPTSVIPALNALRLPASVRASSREFSYVSIVPVNAEFGGNGARFTASVGLAEKFRVLFRATGTEDYQEAVVGASYIITPQQADRLTFALTAGVEYGRFSLSNQTIKTSIDDTGVFTQINTRFVLNNRFELQGGVGVSSFFDVDPNVFGRALYHLTRQLDLSGEFEVGDNDQIGLGVRYYY